MDKVIVMTMYRRPSYTARVLEALLRCHGIHDYAVFLHVDPGHPQVLDLAYEFPHPNKIVTENDCVLGCTRNTFDSLEHGFRLADFVILLEDDTVPAPDCLRYFEWARRRFEDDKEVFTVSAYNKATAAPDSYYKALRVAWFTPWGWGTWRDRWIQMCSAWGFGEYDSWDICVNRLRGNRVQIMPALARTQNIGAEDGTYCPGPEWHQQNQFNEFGAWSIAVDLHAEFELSEE